MSMTRRLFLRSTAAAGATAVASPALAERNEPGLPIVRAAIPDEHAYAVLIRGDSMEPRYFDGERAYVDPHRIPKKNDHVVAQVKSREGEPPYAYMKRFVRWNSEELVLAQYNPDKELRFSHDSVVSVHVIVWAGPGAG